MLLKKTFLEKKMLCYKFVSMLEVTEVVTCFFYQYWYLIFGKFS